MERYKAIIASDKEKVTLREKLAEHLEDSGISVVHLSRVKKSRIRSEIKPSEPDILLIAVSLYYPEEINELRGFVKSVRRHLPSTKIVIHAPIIDAAHREEILNAGADAWIDEKMAYEYLGQTLEDLVIRKS